MRESRGGEAPARGGRWAAACALERGGPDEEERIVGELEERPAAEERPHELKHREAEAVAAAGRLAEEALELPAAGAGGVGGGEGVEVLRGELPLDACGGNCGGLGGKRARWEDGGGRKMCVGGQKGSAVQGGVGG